MFFYFPSVKTVVVKGKAPVDTMCEASQSHHVYHEGKDIYDVMLNQVGFCKLLKSQVVVIWNFKTFEVTLHWSVLILSYSYIFNSLNRFVFLVLPYFTYGYFLVWYYYLLSRLIIVMICDDVVKIPMIYLLTCCNVSVYAIFGAVFVLCLNCRQMLEITTTSSTWFNCLKKMARKCTRFGSVGAELGFEVSRPWHGVGETLTKQRSCFARSTITF